MVKWGLAYYWVSKWGGFTNRATRLVVGYLQSSQDQEDCKVDLEHHVKLFIKELCGHLTYCNQHYSGQGGCKEGAEQRPAKDDLDNYCVVF